jgi:hypothetical protein
LQESSAHPGVHGKEVPIEPIAEEFTINLEDRPGVRGKLGQEPAERNVNILAFHSCPVEARSALGIALDNPASAKAALDRQRDADQSSPRARMGTAELSLAIVSDPGNNASLILKSSMNRPQAKQ